MMVSNCSGERSFSKLKFLKSHLRSCMTPEQLNSLALLNIETNVIRSITAKLREAFLFQVPNPFGIFLITFAILKKPLCKSPEESCKSPYGICNVPKLIKCF